DLKNLSRTDVLHFIQQTYHTDEIIIAISGDYSLKQVEKLSQKIFGHIAPNTASRHHETVQLRPSEHRIIKKPINQAHYMIGAQLFGYFDERKMSMLLLNNLLGGMGMSSILNLGIREKYGIAYTVESNFTMYSDVGNFSIYLGTDEEKLPKAIKLVQKELQK